MRLVGGVWTATVLAALAMFAPVAPAQAAIPRAPALGDWEGAGPEGLPLSFELFRASGRVAVRDLTVGDPLLCPGRFLPTDAYGYQRATYIGPGAPPRLRFLWRPSEVWIKVGMGAPFSPELVGHLLTSRRATLSEPAPQKEPPGCGWHSKRLTWHVAPAKRIGVAGGVWTGTVSAPEGGGAVSLTVSPSGRMVEVFGFTMQCPGGGEAHYEQGPAAVGAFISAAGVFSDAYRPAAFQGRFALGGSVTGTVLTSCGPTPFPFTAHPG